MIYERNWIASRFWKNQLSKVAKYRQVTIEDPFDYAQIALNPELDITLFSTHHHSHDIKLLHYALNQITQDEQEPVFVMRDTLPLKPWLHPYFTTLFTRHFLKGSIPLDQSKPKALFYISDEIKSAHKQGKAVVLFPGSTRDEHYINHMASQVTQIYYLMLQKNSDTDKQMFANVGITYDERNRAKVTFGKAKRFTDFTRKELGSYVLDELARLARVDKSQLDSIDTVAKKINSR